MEPQPFAGVGVQRSAEWRRGNMVSRPEILIVDDQKSMRTTLSALMADRGYGVAEAEDGYQAIEAARRREFSLIFMDIRMPWINGVQTFREIKKIRPEAVVVMMTGFAVADLVKEALEEGAYSVVCKPFEVTELLEIVESALELEEEGTPVGEVVSIVEGKVAGIAEPVELGRRR